MSSPERSAPPSAEKPLRTMRGAPTGCMPASAVSVFTQLKKYAAWSKLTPATFPPRIWESVCGMKTRRSASAYSFRRRF